MKKKYDHIIIGAGIYGLYAARLLAQKKRKVAVLEYDQYALQRASYVNQARVHNGYHYPRSYSTAKKASDYFKRFNHEFSFAINDRFIKIYAIANKYSFTSPDQFEKFCAVTEVPCIKINKHKYFDSHTVSAAYETKEYAFCARKIKDSLLADIQRFGCVDFFYGSRIKCVKQDQNYYTFSLINGDELTSSFVVNSTYASVNQLLNLFSFKLFKIKYEICEIIQCSTSENIQQVGITVMDGPFFSVMPFGFHTHSLTSVAFTPHLTCHKDLPDFPCQKHNLECSPHQLDNCNLCEAKPKSAWRYMSQLASKYLANDITLSYEKSLFAIKPILISSEIDDSRPTLIRTFSKNPTFISVLSGKINTIYDLEEVLI